MSTTNCYEPTCDRLAEVSCSCTFPNTSSCEGHLLKHCKSNNPHNIGSIFLSPVEVTKEGILNFLIEQKSKTFEIKAQVLATFNKTICNYKSDLEEVFKEIDSECTQIISSYIEKIKQTQELFKLKKDPILSLLTLQPSEAVDKVKESFITKKWVDLFSKMDCQINTYIEDFKHDKYWAIQHQKLVKLANDMYINFQEDEKRIIKQDFKNNIEAIIRNNPHNHSSYHNIGLMFYKEKRYEDAIKFYDYAIELHSETRIYHRSRGDALKELGRIDEAFNDYKEVISQNPKDHDTFNCIGDLLYGDKRYEEAIKYYNGAIRINSNKAIYYINKGNAFRKLGNVQEAMDCYRNVLKIEPKNDYANNKIGKILCDKMRQREAIEYFSKAIRVNSKNQKYYINKGSALERLNRRKQALKCFRKVIEIDPNHDISFNWIGKILCSEEKYEEAKNISNRQLKLSQIMQAIIKVKEMLISNWEQDIKQWDALKKLL